MSMWYSPGSPVSESVTTTADATSLTYNLCPLRSMVGVAEYGMLAPNPRQSQSAVSEHELITNDLY